MSASPMPGGQQAGAASVIERLAERFNLNKDEVQQVFDEEHEATEATMEKLRDERLSRAVQDGRLTQEQADKIKEKHEELEAARENANLRDMAPEQRREFMQTKREELKQWMVDNDIPAGPLQENGMIRGGHYGDRRD